MSRKPRILTSLLLALALTTSFASAAENWWDAKWTTRKKIDIDTTGKGVGIEEPIGTTAVLVRLHEGVFSFMSSKEDGSDLRFLADDHKTELKHHVEKWDSLLNEAYVWVQVPDLKPASATSIWLYYGNTEAPAPEAAKETYDANTTLVYHFADASKAGTDSSATGANAEGAPPPAAGSLIGGGLRVFGQTAIKAPAPPLGEWAPGAPLAPARHRTPAAVFHHVESGLQGIQFAFDLQLVARPRQSRLDIGRELCLLVGEALVLALLAGPRELRQRHHVAAELLRKRLEPARHLCHLLLPVRSLAAYPAHELQVVHHDQAQLAALTG